MKRTPMIDSLGAFGSTIWVRLKKNASATVEAASTT